MPKAIAQNFSKLTLSGETLELGAVNIPALVRSYFSQHVNENSGSHSLSTGTGRQNVFVKVCELLKNISGIDNKVRLPEEVAQMIRKSIAAHLQDTFSHLLTEFAEHSVTIKQKEVGLVFDLEDQSAHAYNRAMVKMQRENLDAKESRWAARVQISKLSKQIDKLEKQPTLDREGLANKAILDLKLTIAEAAWKRFDEEAKVQESVATT